MAATAAPSAARTAPAAPPASPPSDGAKADYEAARASAKQPAAAPPAANSNTAAPTANPPPAAPASNPVAPERQAQIAAWAETKSDHSGGFLGIGGTGSSEKVRDALAGKSELGPMSTDEQRVLADRMIDRWDAGRGDGPSGPMQLVEALGDAPDSRAILGQELAARSAGITKATPLDPSKPDANWESRARASSYARSAVDAAGSADDSASAGRLRETISRLGPDKAGDFARALAGNGALGGMPGAQTDLTRTLTALDGEGPSAARSAFVQNAFSAVTADDLAATPDLQKAMGGALAREWQPDDPAAASRDASRLTGILGTDQGRRLLGDGGKDGPSLENRVNALATIRSDASITGDVLKQTDDPWNNSAIIMPGAQAGARQYLDNRGDAPVALAGSDLDNTVGTAMGLPPAVPAGTAPAEAEAAAARGAFSFYGTGDAAEPVKKVADQIRGIAGDASANVTVLPVTYSDGKTGPVQLPLFRVTDPSGAERYVDNTGRRYDDFEDWRTNNKLPPGTQVYPEGGHLKAGADGKVALGQGNTPDTVDTFGEHLTSVVDKVALVGGIVAGGVLIVGTGGLATPVVVGAGAVAAGAGAWGAYRSGSALVDRGEHGQSLNPITDSEARGLWLNLGASVASIGAFGSAARLAELGQAGRAIAPIEASLHGYVQAGAFALDTAAVANQGVDTARNWDRMSAGDRAASILQMGFWGVGAGAGLRASGLRNPGDMFNPIKIRDGILAAHAPGVTADPALPGDAVKIDYDPATGVVQGIRHGPDATPADIALHQRTAQNIQRSLTLEGQVGRLFSGGREPPPGTIGWAARADITKVQERLRTRSAELDAPGLTPERRAEIEEANAVDTRHLDALADEVSSLARDPDRATIDAKNSKRKRVDGTARTGKVSGYDIEAERAKLPVGETTRTVGGNTVTYYVNEQHNPTQVDLTLTEIPPSKKRSSAENKMTAAVGKSGGRPRTTREERDNGGHIAGFQFLHEQGLINQFPQNEDFNQRVFNEIDGEVRQWVEQGAEVHTRFTLGEGDTPATRVWGGKRPSRVTVEYEVTDPKTGDVIYKQPVTEFKNEAGQEFDGYGDRLIEENGPGGAKVDVAARMREALGLE
ncbi:DUF4781 domain-containing protein [Methylobacterium brachythecii]|uniref:DUF4781 domain-containing protein n=1 Tax=Methylobacterium brachythecii TaxID=1176177 RepID=A0A7W6AHA8_9HYPH|nr:DUF4781 domain-containing protein [Methylobacterium brachythecii]MBB3903312.1 hypothetical protein [Methylobacterium brachythecii]GLS46838.1 hypothetical protein GCM10007884_48350 [Methylobacterium brachythecii]